MSIELAVQIFIVVFVAAGVWGFVHRFAELLMDDIWAWWKRGRG